MIKLLSSLNQVEQTIILVWFPIIFLILIIFLVKAGINIRKGKAGFSIFFGKDRQGFQSPHHECEHRQDGVDAIRKIYGLVEELVDIKFGYIVVIKEQMNAAENSLLKIMNLIQKKYLTELSEKLRSRNLIDSPSFNSYRHVLKILSDELLSKMRVYFRENRFAERTETDFNDYVKTKIFGLISHTTEFLNEEYWYKEDLSREDVYDFNQEIVSEIKAMAQEAFRKAREIAIKHKEDNEIKLTNIESKRKEIIKMFDPEIV